MRGVQSILVIIAASLLLACSHNLPQGWRSPTNEELRDTWRDGSAGRYATVKGDFNGDGIVDEAKLLLRKNGSGFGLFAFVSRKGDFFKMYQLDEMQDGKLMHAVGIKHVACGSYMTACGKGYWDCRKDEPPEIAIRNESIDYFKLEGANSFFYWDGDSHNFNRIWISD
jgi:hypothetical protein